MTTVGIQFELFASYADKFMSTQMTKNFQLDSSPSNTPVFTIMKI